MFRVAKRALSTSNIRRFSSHNRLPYVSDIHLELWKDKMPVMKEDKEIHGLALLGDIGNPFSDNYREFLMDCSSKFNNVYLLAGNHEYYHTVDKLPNLRNYVIDQIFNVVASINRTNTNVYFLDNNHCPLKIEDRTHILIGSTLFSNHKIDSKGPNTPKHIVKFNKFLNHEHIYSLEWITRFLHSVKLNNQIWNSNISVTMLTHYVPTKQLIEPKYLKNRSLQKYKETSEQSRFFCNLEYMMNDPIKHWLCGHTHSKIEKRINNVECGINTVGYMNTEFICDSDKDLELELKYIDL